MALRRSSRLRSPPDQKLSNDTQDASAQGETGTKWNNPAGQEAVKTTGIVNVSKKQITKLEVRTAASKVDQSDMQDLDKLSSLSPEIFGMIANNIVDQSAISALSRTSKRLYSLMTPRLYNRVAVAAMFHAHIAKLIRTLEPHLTIKQKKQLKKEGKYKGQREKYPTGLDEEKVPTCAGYVQQLIIGASDPGKKHRYIVDRYYEEALKNMANINIVETSVVNESICEGIASLAYLKALSIRAYEAKSSDMAPLAHIKNLKHLNLQIGCEVLATCQSIIRNSMSTLQSLDILTNSSSSHFLHDWEKSLKSNGHNTTSRAEKGSDFPALRSFKIKGMMIDEEFIREFPRVFEISKLRELSFGYLRDAQTLLWPFLTNLITSYKHSNTPLDLRTLSIDMDDSQWPYNPEHQRVQFAAKSAFVASFDALTTLKLSGYGQYSSNEGFENPGLSDTLLRAILKHENLRVLKLSYKGIISGLEIPYLGAKPIGVLIDSLPHLREFQFAPDEPQMDEISQALCRGRNLESVDCFPLKSWTAFPRPQPLGINILFSIVLTFMSNAKVDADCKEFVWEDHYKLNRINVSYSKWDIASKFGKRGKGYGTPEKMEVHVEGSTREVWHQIVAGTQFFHVGYDPLFEWVTKVEKDIE